jgi:outer membrane protein OmpU
MQHKLLLGSTALVSAGLLMSGGAQAQEEMRVGGIEVVLGGYTEFGVSAASRDTLDDRSNTRNYAFFMDNELHLDANAATEGGILYGSHMELEVGSGLGFDPSVTVDEIGLYFSGNFGRFEFGQEDGANDVMGIGAADAQAGTGGIDGDTTNLVQFESLDTGDNTKATYFTPRIAGFQLGASFAPDDGDGVTDNDGGFENNVSGGANWVGALGPLDLTVAATAIWGQKEPGPPGAGTDDNDDLFSWDAGVLLGFGGLSAGVNGWQNTDPNSIEAYGIAGGLKYGFGAANVSVGYALEDPQGDAPGDTNNFFVASGDVGLLPGVTLKGDVSYATDDPNAHADEDDPDDTIAGIVTVQLDY